MYFCNSKALLIPSVHSQNTEVFWTPCKSLGIKCSFLSLLTPCPRLGIWTPSECIEVPEHQQALYLLLAVRIAPFLGSPLHVAIPCLSSQLVRHAARYLILGSPEHRRCILDTVRHVVPRQCVVCARIIPITSGGGLRSIHFRRRCCRTLTLHHCEFILCLIASPT